MKQKNKNWLFALLFALMGFIGSMVANFLFYTIKSPEDIIEAIVGGWIFFGLFILLIVIIFILYFKGN